MPQIHFISDRVFRKWIKFIIESLSKWMMLPHIKVWLEWGSVELIRISLKTLIARLTSSQPVQPDIHRSTFGEKK